jgi:hypothetical protein
MRRATLHLAFVSRGDGTFVPLLAAQRFVRAQQNWAPPPSENGRVYGCANDLRPPILCVTSPFELLLHPHGVELCTRKCSGRRAQDSPRRDA